MNMGQITPDGTAIVRAFMPGMLANAKLEAMRPRFAAPTPDPQPEPQPQPQPANPQRAADMAFLNSVVSASADMWADDLADKIEAIGTAYEGDDEVLALWGQAIQAYTDFMVSAMA